MTDMELFPRLAFCKLHPGVWVLWNLAAVPNQVWEVMEGGLVGSAWGAEDAAE